MRQWMAGVATFQQGSNARYIVRACVGGSLAGMTANEAQEGMPRASAAATSWEKKLQIGICKGSKGGPLAESLLDASHCALRTYGLSLLCWPLMSVQ